MKKKKSLVLVVVLTLALCTTVFAATLLNWTGRETIMETNQFLQQSSKKMQSQKDKINDLKDQVADLESQLEDGNGGWNPEVEDLKNQIIEKNNQIDHLTRELQTANTQAAEQQNILNQVKGELSSVGIDIWNMYE